MTFVPTQINPAEGLPGQEVNALTAVYHPLTHLSDGTAKAGAFAFPVAAQGGNTSDLAGAYPFAGVKASGKTCLGLITRVVNAAIVAGENEDVYPKGTPLAIATRGEFYIKAVGTVKAGHAVMCDPATGAVTFNATAQANATGWVAMHDAAEGELVVISNRG